MTNLPIQGQFNITAIFGQQGLYWKNGHKGIDITCSNTNIYATTDGVINTIGWDPDGWGRYIKIKDYDNNYHIYCHLVKDSVKVSQGQKITSGTTIGTMGTTGNSSGVHLHYQINNSTNTPIDPTNLLGIPNQKGSYNSKDYMLNGWRQDNNGWKFYQNNSYLTNKWIEDSQGWCYVGKDGYALTNSWSKDSQGWCYLDKEGHAIKSKWKQIKEKWYYFNDKHHALTGLQKINNKYYYFAEQNYDNIKECQLIITNNNGEIQ